MRCGRKLCILPKALPPPEANLPSCPGGHECVEHQFLTCFSPPCHQWGVCSTPDPPTPLHTQCEPNSGYLDNNCAHITLIFKKDKVPQVSKSYRSRNLNRCLLNFFKLGLWVQLQKPLMSYALVALNKNLWFYIAGTVHINVILNVFSIHFKTLLILTHGF